MTSKNARTKREADWVQTMASEPKTPHEEVMFVVESTNDIVSKILEKLEGKNTKVLIIKGARWDV